MATGLAGWNPKPTPRDDPWEVIADGLATVLRIVLKPEATQHGAEHVERYVQFVVSGLHQTLKIDQDRIAQDFDAWREARRAPTKVSANNNNKAAAAARPATPSSS